MTSGAIVDDVGAAMSHLSEFGLEILRPVVRQIRERIVLLAAMNCWPIVDHHRFAAWARAAYRDDHVWLIIDPLLRAEDFGDRAMSVRVSRAAGPAGWEFEFNLPEEARRLVAGQSVGIIDDVAFSGGTLLRICEQIAAAGGRVSRLIVASSTARANNAIAVSFPDAGYFQFLPADHSAIHLRDGCPCLPFAGRRIKRAVPITSDAGVIEVRTPPSAFRGGVWGLLCADPGLRVATTHARKQIASACSAALARPALVADLAQFSAHPSIQLFPNQAATAGTRLDTLFS